MPLLATGQPTRNPMLDLAMPVPTPTFPPTAVAGQGGSVILYTTPTGAAASVLVHMRGVRDVPDAGKGKGKGDLAEGVPEGTATPSNTCAGLTLVAAIVVANLCSIVLATRLLGGAVVGSGSGGSSGGGGGSRGGGGGGGQAAAPASTVNPLFLISFNVSCDIASFAFIGAPYACGAPWARRRAYTSRHVARAALPLVLVYQLGNWLFFVGLQELGVTVATIFSQSACVWVLGLSALLLPGERLTRRRLGAVGVTALGVALTGCGAWDHTPAVALRLGALLLSSVLWAAYQVLLKRWLGEAGAADTLLFVGFRGLSNAMCAWPVLLIAAAAGESALPATQLEGPAWGALLAMAGLSSCQTLFTALGIAKTSPLFIGIGATMSAPASILFLDIAWHGQRPGWPRLLGCSYVVLGFAILLWPVPPSPSSAAGARKTRALTGAVAAALAGGVAAVVACALDAAAS